MKVGIFINSTKTEATIKANAFTGMLLKNDIKYKIVHLKEDCKDVDLIAVFGGDGTILSVVDYAMTYNIPILAINTGKVGFLSSLESDEIEKAIELIKNDCDFEKRSVMKVTVNGVKYYALNEIVVERRIEGSSKSEVASLNLELNGNFVDKYIGDGIILSTPTGSTAYSLSAGGSILTPDINAFLATPICSHSLHIKPLVYNDNMVAKVSVNQGSTKCAIYVDGKFISQIKSGESIEVSKSKRFVKFYKTESNFFERLLVKLNSWGYTR